MMATQRILKYPLADAMTDEGIAVPYGQVVHAGVQGDTTAYVWVSVSSEDGTRSDSPTMHVRIVGTGWEYDGNVWVHEQTFTNGVFVWHVLRERSFRDALGRG